MRFLLGFILCVIHCTSFANTHRTPQLNNQRVQVWQTIVYPNEAQKLLPHRHERDRVVVALTDGTLLVTNNRGQSHLLHFKKNHAYYLTKDVPGETHTDANLGKNPVAVMVIELKDA